MKKWMSLLSALLVLQVASAQDLKKVQTAFLLGKTEDAKTEIDKAMADPKAKTNPEAWYWKSRTYAAINKNEALRAKYPAIKKEAHEAFKQYIQLDPGFAQVKLKGPDGFFDMYSVAFNTGIKDFQEKKWPAAGENFGDAVFYSDYMFANKWTNSTAPFDTTALLYAAYAYQNAQQPDMASQYYARLAEAKCTGEGFADIYRYLLDVNTKKKDKASFDKYLALGKAVYPKENWEDFEIEYIDQNLTLAEKTALYDERDKAGTLTENHYLQFGDVFVNVRLRESDSTIFDKYTEKAAEAFKKAYAMNNQNALAAYNVGIIQYNHFNAEDDKYAANIRKLQQMNSSRVIEKDPKKKPAADAKFKAETDAVRATNAAIEKVALGFADESIDWLNKAFVVLKDKSPRTSTERNVINKSVDFMANLYLYKRDRARGKDQKAFDAFDAKYNEFDKLHDSFK